MITGQIIGQKETVRRLQLYYPSMRTKLRETIQRLTFALLANVKEKKLSGQVLRVRSGRLRRSITQELRESPSATTGIVGTNVNYARPHEYGFKGVVSVREHLRMAKSGKAHQVRGHGRNVDLPAKSFARSALNDMRPQIFREINNTLVEVAKGLHR